MIKIKKNIPPENDDLSYHLYYLYMCVCGLPACEECRLRHDRIARVERPEADRSRAGGEAPWKNYLILNLLERNLQ